MLKNPVCGNTRAAEAVIGPQDFPAPYSTSARVALPHHPFGGFYYKIFRNFSGSAAAPFAGGAGVIR
jgi:hypothetical protein